jgi:hypothetical protein
MITLLSALSTYDNGATHSGSFSQLWSTTPSTTSSTTSNTATSTIVANENTSKRACQLLSQMVLANVDLLGVFIEVFVAASEAVVTGGGGGDDEVVAREEQDGGATIVSTSAPAIAG